MRVPPAWHGARRGLGIFAFLWASTGFAVAQAPAVPDWLVLRPGQVAIVEAAPWPMQAPEAALTGTLESAAKEPESYEQRPADALGQPIGLRVQLQEIFAGGVVRVQPDGATFTAFSRLDRLVPEVPWGTPLVVAGGFGNYADFYPALGSREPESLPTGTALTAIGVGVAPYDPDGADFVRVRVRVESGPKRGKNGWIPVIYTGLPSAGGTSETERACRCRLLEFR